MIFSQVSVLQLADFTATERNLREERGEFYDSQNLITNIENSNEIQLSSWQFSLPLIHQKHSQPADSLESEKFQDFWTVDDMFTFENIGFSHTVGDYKYLVCADCEMGPVGYHEMSTKKNFIALTRVKHEN